MFHAKPMAAKLEIRGAFECRDADGNVIKTIELQGSIPLTDEQAQELSKGAEDGADDSE